MRALCREASAEAYLVARTQVEKVESIGEFDPNAFATGEDMEERADGALATLAEAWRGAIKQYMGIWRDLKVKKRKTEVDMQVAPIVATGREQGIPTPVNTAVLEIVHQIEAGKRGMGWDNLDEIVRRSGAGSIK